MNLLIIWVQTSNPFFFNSFVSIDLNDYNELILKNKEQEEMIVAQGEEIVELEEKNDAHKGLLINSWKIYLKNTKKYNLRRLVEEPNEKQYVEYHYEELYKSLSTYDLPVSITNEIIKLALEDTKKIIEDEQQENENGN